MKKIIIFMSLFFASHFASGAGQILNPGDGIRITFFNITEEISGDYFIQQNGAVQLPYLGSIAAVNRGFEEIREEVISKYDSLYRNPELTIEPLLRINILGEVADPGYYVVTDVEKLSGVIALAGGETADADLEDIYLVRDNQEIKIGSETIYNVDGQNVQLESGDKIYVPRRWWVSIRNTAVVISALTLLVTVIALFVN